MELIIILLIYHLMELIINIIKLHSFINSFINRLILFIFELSFVENPKEPHERHIDINLRDKILNNKEGVIRWLVEAAMYYTDNINTLPPSFVEIDKKKYMNLTDPYMEFIDRYFYKTDSDKDTIELQILVDYYKNTYCVENNMKKPKKEIEKKFIHLLQTDSTNKNIIGLKPKDDYIELFS